MSNLIRNACFLKRTKMDKQYVHITAANGPLECQLAAAKILAELLTDFRNNGLKVEVIQRFQGDENGTITSALLEVSGRDLETIVQPWIGTIQWIQKSPYRPNHGRKNWFVGVFLLEMPVSQKWNEKDFEIQAVRSSGAGGQHVNKVSSAIRIMHVPTGTQVFVQESRSQLQNKKLAWDRIIQKLESTQLDQMVQLAEDSWSQHRELERGNPVKVFTGLQIKPKKPEKSFKSTRSKLKRELDKEWKI